MIDSVGEPTEDRPHPRADLDDALAVDTWHRFGPHRAVATPDDAGAPSWWKGEEEASESFMREMGIRIDENGQVVRR